ncbi:hypothetical protein ACJMK2_039987 [Sinanodonta woodiana]|uniref:Uncharacterized protein n=1 Tax=Sinanodonta woodiana TaxID=1069815 RepID=A0ABD3WDK8_SINWO
MVETTEMSLSEGSLHDSALESDHGKYNCYTSRTMPILNGLDQSIIICAGCGCRILERYFLYAADKQWHVHCLRCADCKLSLDTELTCFAREGHIYCKEDYYRRFGAKRCARCQMGILANELIMRARDCVYHLSCFVCASCNKPLTTGDQFGMISGLIYCRTDYELFYQEDQFQRLSPDMLGLPEENVPFYSGFGHVQKVRPRKRKSMMTEPDGCIQGLGHISDEHHAEMMVREGYATGHPPRQKRVRTSFKHHQLRTMKSYFALNHNPDAKDLKQLAQKTGLSKRVLQVWFQNARAKHRRNMLKQDPEKNTESENKVSEEKKEESDNTERSHSPSMSDGLSSSHSVSDLQDSTVEHDHSSDSLSDLFTDTAQTMNAEDMTMSS